MSDAEWAVVEPALPVPAWTLGKGGRPGGYCRRDIVDGIRYLVKEGIQSPIPKATSSASCPRKPAGSAATT